MLCSLGRKTIKLKVKNKGKKKVCVGGGQKKGSHKDYLLERTCVRK